MALATTITDNLMILIYIVIIIFLTTAISQILAYLMRRREKFGRDMTAAYLIKDIITYTIYFISLMYILRFFGINLAGTLLSLGIVGIAVSFAAQDIISNFFSGIILIVGKSIKVGDTVEVDGKKGTVKSISLRSTVIVDDLGVKKHVPNSTLTNDSYFEFKPTELRRIDLIVGLPLDVDVLEFREYITKKVVTYDAISDDPKPGVYAKETSFKQVKVKVSVWVKDFDSEDRRKLIIDNKDEYKLVIANDIRKYINTVGEKNE